MNSQQDAQLKALKLEKGIIAGKFKHLQKDSVEYHAQMEAMKSISAQIKTLEAELKNNHLPTTQHAEASPSTATIQATPFFDLSNAKDYTGEFNIHLTHVAEATDWPEFVVQNPTRLPSHNPAWLEVIERSFGHSSYLLCARDPQGKLLAGLPFTLMESLLFGKFGVSVPYLNYGGIVSQYPNLHQQLMHHLKEIRAQLGLKHIEVRSIYPGLSPIVSTKKAGMILPLPASDEQLEKQLGSKLRAQYKKAEEYSPRYRVGGMELLADFYQVFAHNMRDLGTPVYGKNWFRNILQHPGIQSHLLVVYIQNKAVAAAFLVQSGNLMEIPWASTLKSANRFNANMWMYRQILSFAITSGCQFFDFGRSTLDAGTFKFKQQWGAEPCQHYWYSILPEDSAPPEINPDNPKLKLLIAAWRRLPVWLSKIIGPLIIKGIP